MAMEFCDRVSVNAGTPKAIIGASKDGTYPGVNLGTKFSTEIANYTDVWAWLHARIAANDFTGIHVGDYIPISFTSPSSFTLNAQVAGINTYKNYGDDGHIVPSHIDFICDKLWPTTHVMNKKNYNNGVPAFTPEGGTEIAAQEHPWLASDLYHYINSLPGYVPDAATENPAMTAVDYTADGIYSRLPAALKAVIIEKRAYIPKRFSASELLTDDNAGDWADIGKLWIPSEVEVYGSPRWSGQTGYGMAGFVQYPLFIDNTLQVKKKSGSRSRWWLLSACSGNTTGFCNVHSSGYAYYHNASFTSIAAPVCFRVA